MREKRMERMKEVSRMIRSSGIESEHSLSHTHTYACSLLIPPPLCVCVCNSDYAHS